MRTVNLSRATLAVLIAAVLLGGVVVGSALPAWREGATATPSPAVAMPTSSPSGLPAADVVGEDLARLPRYPGSVRSEFVVSTDEQFRLTAAEFMADASMGDVRAFYQGVIIEHGWQRADIGFSADEWTYVLVDGSTEALIEIEVTGGLIEIDLQVSEPVEMSAPQPTLAPQPTPAPIPAPPPQRPAPPPPGDDDGDDDDDGGGGDDSGDDGTDG